MRQNLIGHVLAGAALIAGVVLGPANARAEPTSTFAFFDELGSTSGGVIWFNRSVQTQGEVCDSLEPGFQWVRFMYWLTPGGVGSPWDVQTRTVSNGCRSFNFVVEGPRGGIQRVDVAICNSGMECHPIDSLTRP